MGDPYRAKGWPRVNRETRTDLETFTMRLELLGASPDEVAAVTDGWDDFDGDWTPERRHELLHMGDDGPRGVIVAGREEYDYANTTEEEADARAEAQRLRTARTEAAQRIYGTVPSIVAWMGDDPVRARALRELEEDAEGAGRKTLLAAIDEIIT